MTETIIEQIQSLKRGTVEVFTETERELRCNQAKDEAARANGRRITLADGETLFMGSSGTGAPEDGADSTRRR